MSFPYKGFLFPATFLNSQREVAFPFKYLNCPERKKDPCRKKQIAVRKSCFLIVVSGQWSVVSWLAIFEINKRPCTARNSLPLIAEAFA
jgi:hypothetical protein